MLDKNILQTLKNVGLEEKEAHVYLANLELGSASVSQIAQRAGLKRPIVYYILEKLKSRGYIYRIEEGGVKKFSAADPSKVFQVASGAVEELRFMLPIIRALQEKGAKKPRIEYLEDRESILSLFRLYDRGKSQRYITSIDRLDVTDLEDPGMWAKRYESGQIKARAKTLLSDTPKDRAWAKRVAATGQSVRFIPPGMDMDFSIVDGLFSITSLEPLFSVVIHSESAARSAAALFDLVWKSRRK